MALDMLTAIIGVKKFVYDVWGDTVNTASRMESSGLPGRVQLSEATASLLGPEFQIEQRGEVEIKGKGRMTTYWLTGRRRDGGDA
jgi:class 3 adenylate cyclase